MESTMTPSLEERHAPSFFAQHKFTIISVAILVVALIPLLILSSHTKTTPPAEQAMQQAVTPTQALTQQNAQPTLDATDQQVQAALDESQTEVNAVNQINTSSDSTTGL